jgi:hypothetical protein
MTGRNGKYAGLWIAFIALMVAIALPSAALGQGRGRGRGDKCDKFVNCHDARDGRVDGRGPRTDRVYDDDDDYDYDRGQRGRQRRDNRRDDDYDYRNGGSNRNDIERQAVDFGYREGYRAGRDDRRDGQNYSYDDHNTYRDATAGYRSSYGDRELYRRYFQEGFRRGYDEGYRNRSTSGTGRRSRARDILGDIIGRP